MAMKHETRPPEAEISAIERLTEAQLEEVVRLYLEAFTGPPRFERWTWESARELVSAHERCGAVTCLARAPERGEVLGFSLLLPLSAWPAGAALPALGVPPDSYYLSNIAVCERGRGRGIGALLLAAGEEQARAAGFTAMSARCREDAPAIQALLRGRGYRQVADYTAEVGGSTARRLLFVRWFSGGPSAP